MRLMVVIQNHSERFSRSYANTKLYSLDIVTWFCFIIQITTSIFTYLRGGDNDSFDPILTGLDLFEKELTLRATQFFGGKEVGGWMYENTKDW